MNEVIAATKVDYVDLIQVWEASVRATHDFLTETDIEHYKPLILNEYFDQLQLFCMVEGDHISGFIGLDGELIQMLFIDPTYRGKGIGKTLVSFAVENFNANKVDVNEQNEQAVGFYKHLGFEVTECSEFDAAGKPYPILSMALTED